MDHFNAIFILVPRCRLAVCRECSIGLVKARFKTHLNAHHKYLSVATRKAVVKAAKDIEELAEGEEDIVYPAPESGPVPGLAVRRDGWICTASTIATSSFFTIDVFGGLHQGTVQDAKTSSKGTTGATSLSIFFLLRWSGESHLIFLGGMPVWWRTLRISW